MLMLAEKMKNAPIMSLQTGAEIARTGTAVIDPGTLDVVAYRLSGSRLDSEGLLLLTVDVREVSSIGLIVDSADELIHEEDLVTAKSVLKLGFDLLDLAVIDDMKHKLGRIHDYAIDPMTFRIHQLYVKRPLLRSLQTSDLIISRTQIIEINDTSVIVSSASLKERPAPAAVSSTFINPFRSPSPQPPENSSPNAN